MKNLPILVPKPKEEGEIKGLFPVDQLSSSAMIQFGANPVMFKINYIDRNRVDNLSTSTQILGKAFHWGCEVYEGGSDEHIITNEAEALSAALTAGLKYIDEYEEGYIDWKKSIPNKEKMAEKFSFLMNEYIKWTRKYHNDYETVELEDKIIAKINVDYKGQQISLPIPIKVYIDRVFRKPVNGEKRLCLQDYKSCHKFSDPSKLDGKKIMQAVTYYLAAYVKYGEAPYSMTFTEVKHSKSKATPTNPDADQIKEYEFVFEEHELFFDLFFRYYGDVVTALSGEQVYVPNMQSLYDDEIALISYIHRLDEPEELANQMKKEQVANITELLRKKVENSVNMKSMESVMKKLAEVKPIDYSNMEIQDQIKIKYAQFGKGIHFEKIVESNTVDTILFTPAVGTKMKDIRAYSDDVEQILGVSDVRVLAPVPNTNFVGFEVPRSERKFVKAEEKATDFKLNIGVDSFNKSYKYDITEAPHMLIAGATGSGKSVFIASLIEQLLQNKKAELHLFDPKRVELSLYEDEARVVEYADDIMAMRNSLESLVGLMNKRYKMFKQEKARDIESYNAKGKRMKYKFVVIEEFGDLITTKDYRTETEITGYYKDGRPKVKVHKIKIAPEIENFVLKLAQKARAAGIHLIVATQRPSVDIISGTIKANFPVKVGLRMVKSIDSKVLLDEVGAEKLKGKGDMLFADETGTYRLQGYSL